MVVSSRRIRYKESENKGEIKVGADGKVVPPAAEKSFIQKYWLYIVPALIIIMMSGGEEPGKEGTASAAKK